MRVLAEEEGLVRLGTTRELHWKERERKNAGARGGRTISWDDAMIFLKQRTMRICENLKWCQLGDLERF